MILSFSVRAQYADSYPDFFSTWFQNPAFSQAAFIPDSSKVNLNFQYKNRTGPFSKIHTVVASADRIFRNPRQVAHVFRILVSDEKTGPFISRLNIQLNYVFRQPLGEDVFVAAGISGGMMQSSFTAPSSTSFGTARVPDGRAGFLFRKKNFQTGISVLQLLNNSYKPVKGSLQLRRFSSFYVSQKKDLSLRSGLSIFFRWDLMPEVRDNFHTLLQYSYLNIIQCAAGYGNYSGLTFLAGFCIPIGNDRFNLSLANNSPFLSPTAIPVNSLEFATGYSVR